MPFSDYILLIVGFVAGIHFFFKGFRVYREYRVLADTPEIPIRSIPMGLVEVHGKAKGDQLMNSPVTKTPCLFYRVDIERWQQGSRGGGSWVHFKTDTNGAKFYLEDQTGKALVDPRAAEFDLITTAKRETRPSPRSALVALLTDSKAYLKMTEKHGGRDVELETYAGSVAGSPDSSPAASLERLGALAIPNIGGGSPGGYRLTEYCILADHWYDVTGTCIENPNPKDETDRNMIVKGTNEPTFLISWRSEGNLEGTLRKRAATYVFGGAGLSVLCLAFLLANFGWL